MIRGIHIQTHRLRAETFMKYATEIGLVAMIYLPSLIKTGSGIPNLIGGIHRHSDTQHGDFISL
jgi:hypothetical protein